MRLPESHKDPRHWHDLWACWLALFPYIPHSEAPDTCSWTHSHDALILEQQYKQREEPFLFEIEQSIDAISKGLDCTPSAETRYFLGLRWSVIEDFLSSLTVTKGQNHWTIIPPAALPEQTIFRWLMIDWWNSHGVKRLVELEITERTRFPDEI
jgi:hypothetical protein